MSIPGFSADASLYRAQRNYVAAGGRPPFPAGPAPPLAPFSGSAVLYPISWRNVVGPLVGIEVDFNPVWFACDTPGSPCCSRDSEVSTRHCHRSLGCNTATGQCEPCGAAGQVCCDGDYTGFSLKGYKGFLLNSQERTTTCNPGLRCDAVLASDGKTWLGTRRCQPCGVTKGGPCCAPDPSYGLGRCFADAITGERLVCSDPYADAGAVCMPCGTWGQAACIANGPPCGAGLVRDLNDICGPCGNIGQPMCDDGVPCRPGGVPHKFRDECVPAGGPNEPCDPTAAHGCRHFGTFCNANKICEPCGNPGQLCCPPYASMPGFSTASGCMKPAECRDTATGRRCTGCGFENGPVCQHETPCQSGEAINGWCRPCGKEGQVCCRQSASIRCFDGMICRDNTCKKRESSGGGNTEQWKTCSGADYTITTVSRPVTIETEHGCTTTVGLLASTQEEAFQCARTIWGDAVVETPGWFHVWMDCDNGDCKSLYYPAKDQDAAEDCAKYSNPSCNVRDLPCP